MAVAVAVIVAVIVGAPVIVAVHVNVTGPVAVAEKFRPPPGLRPGT